MPRRRKSAEAANNGAAIGHNSNLTDEQKNKLAGFVSDIERIQGEVKELTEERSEIFAAAKEVGFDTGALRHLLKMRAMEADKRDALEAAIDAYARALGGLAGTPLGQAAMKAAGLDDDMRAPEGA